MMTTRIEFPQDEHPALEARYRDRQTIFTTRCSAELGRYQEGQVLETPWGQAIVPRVTRHEGISTHPFLGELTPAQVKTIQTPYDFVEMTPKGTHTYSNGVGEWDVFRLWELAAELPVRELDPEAFHEWEEYNWESNITLGSLAEHIRRVLKADISHPVILSAEGHVMDGCHRLVRAKLEGTLVKTVQFSETPTPDRILPRGCPCSAIRLSSSKVSSDPVRPPSVGSSEEPSAPRP